MTRAVPAAGNRKQRRAAKRKPAAAAEREYETLLHAAQRVDLSVWTLRDRINRGELRAWRSSSKPGSVILVRRADIDAMLTPYLPEGVTR